MCVIAAAPDGAACEDACLTGASCRAGRCVGDARSCDDRDACTVDLCASDTGCTHAARVCPAPADPCRVARCDPQAGCVESDVADGTACGTSDCALAHVCIAGACVQRPVPASAACAVSSLSAGYGHTCAAFSGAPARCWGGNSGGQVGDNSTQARNVATPIGVELVSVASGASHSCGLTAEGTLYCWGANISGSLGDGTTDPHLSPTLASAVSGPVRRVSCGREVTCVVLEATGGVQCFGGDLWGERGAGAAPDGLLPNDVVGLTSGVADVAAGWEFTCALTTAGGVSCWGHNNSGQLGGGTTASQTRAPVPVMLAGPAVAVTAGGTHACALLIDGRAQCWGANDDGRLGNGGREVTYPPVDVVSLPGPVTAITAGYWHTCAIAANQGFCWGTGYTGQLGDAQRMTSFTPVQVRLSSAPRAIAAGGFHSCATLDTGNLECWGSNGLGQVGNGLNIERDVPTAVSVP